MSDVLNVGVAELKISTNSAILASFGLGSCVAVAMYDPLKKMGGLAHVMLPESRGKDSLDLPGKFADTAVARLLEEIEKQGARRKNVRCKIVGGSQMFEIPGLRKSDSTEAGGQAASHIGARNIAAVKEQLEVLAVPLVGEDTGGNYGRTVKFNTCTGEVEVSSIYHGRTLL